MKYVLIFAALLTAIVATLGQTTRLTNGAKSLTGVGFIVIGMAIITAIASIVIGVREDRAKKRLRNVWGAQLDLTLSETRTLLRYLAINVKLEQVHGPSSIKYDEMRNRITTEVKSLGELEGVEEIQEPEVSRQELIDLLGEFSVNPRRFPHRAWPLPPSWKPRQVQSIEQELSIRASEILTGFDKLVDEYGDVLDLDRRALVEELRKSPFLQHLAAIREVAAEARIREDSESYPVCVLEPGIQGAPLSSLERLFELIDELAR